MWIYAREFNRETLQYEEPTYDSYVYSKTAANIEITPEIFTELINNIYVE